MELKKTPFYQKHLDNNGKIVDFSGWALPVAHQSTLSEAQAVRKSCGIFDASHMGELHISGEGSFSFLQELISNDITNLEKGYMQYNLFLNSRGGIMDDCMIYSDGSELMCVVNAVNKDKIYNWLKSKATKNIVIVDKSDKTALIAIQGPKASKIVCSALGEAIEDLAYLSFINLDTDNGAVLISRSGYTGEDGFEIYVDWEKAGFIWDELVEAGSDDIIPCGLGARDILRIEAGYPLYGHEIAEDIDPYSASLAWALKVNKEFIAKGALADIRASVNQERRIGFIMQEKAVARQGYAVYKNQVLIGRVTSGAFSPNTGTFIGMAIVDSLKTGSDDIEIEIRNNKVKAKIASFPFIQLHTKGVCVNKH
jgi:glycine cleavage system T protein